MIHKIDNIDFDIKNINDIDNIDDMIFDKDVNIYIIMNSIFFLIFGGWKKWTMIKQNV